MKIALITLFGVILLAQQIYALPHSFEYRIRREAITTKSLTNRRAELFEFATDEILRLLKETIVNEKKLLEKVVHQANESELKNDLAKNEIEKFQKLIDRANNLPDKKDEESVEKLFDLFGDVTDFVDHYDELKTPTEEEKLIQRLLSDNHAILLSFQFFAEFIRLHSLYEAHIQEYVDNLTEEERVKEANFLLWFESFKNYKDTDDMIDTTMKFFEFIDDENSKET